MRLNSISTRTMLILVSVSILIVLVLGGLWLYTTKQSIESDLYSSDIKDARHMAESVKMYMDDISSNLNIVSSDPYTLEALQSNDSARLMQMLENLKSNSPNPDAVLIVDNTGQVLYSTTPSHSPDIKADSWYDDMTHSNGTYITGLYKSKTLNDYAFAIMAPIRDNNTIVGRLMVIFTPETLQDSLKAHNLDDRDNIVVVDRSGNVISSNDLKEIGLNMNLSSYTPVRLVIAGNNGVIEHNDSWDQQLRISAYQTVAGGSWGVIVSTPKSVEYKQLNELLGWILAVLFFLIIAVSALGYFVSQYLTRPIVDLSGTMRKVSSGDYSLRANMGRNDEIGELAHTFDGMMDRLEDARSQLEMYLDLMGHDINNLNQVALGYLQMAEEMVDSGASVQKENKVYIRKPLEALENSTTLIENIRKLQRVKTEEMRTKTVNISEVLAELKGLYSQVPGRAINIEINCPGKCEVTANDLIKDVFSNLIWNAIKHSDAGKPLTIGLSIAEKIEDGARYYEITVEDNGPGIPDKMKDYIFSRFGRGSTKARGSGLGLYLVKSLAESYHGTVRVEDRVKGDHTRGSRFVVSIPSV